MSIGLWTNQGTVKSTISGRHPECTTVLYEGGAVILTPNADGKLFKMWGSTINGPCYAESNDGITWSDYASNPLIPGISSFHETKVHKVGNTYYLYDSPIPGGPIAVYTATDGVTFTLQNASAIAVGGVGALDHNWAGQLAVVDIVGGTWYAYYAGQQVSNGGYVMIQATSTDGINWSKNYSNTITANGPSNFEFHKVGSTYYGWSQIVFPGIPAFGSLGLPSDIMRFSSSSPSGPWTNLSTCSIYRTQASEGVGLTTGQVADPTGFIELNGNVYVFFTAKSAGQTGNNGVINCAIASSMTLARLVQSYEGIVNIPIPWGTGLTPLQLGTLASDNFNRADANPLSGNWAQFHSGGGYTTAQLVSNQVQSTVIGSSGEMFNNGVAWPNDQWSSIQIVSAFTGTTSYAGTALRMNTSGVITEYRLFGASASSPRIIIQKALSGTFSTIASIASFTVAVNDTIVGVVSGSTLSIYDNGNLLISGIDGSSPIASGSAGFLVSPATSLTNDIVDNWSGGGLAFSIGGNCSVGGATISYSGTASGSVTADSQGNYIIPSLSAGAYTITPSKTGSSFSPASSSQTIASADITGVNFTAIKSSSPTPVGPSGDGTSTSGSGTRLVSPQGKGTSTA